MTMSVGELLSALINIAVGVYFIRFYPAFAKRRFQGRRLPPLFAFLVKALPVVGYVLIAGTVFYLAMRLFNPA